MGRRPGYATIAVLRALAEDARYGLDIMERTGLPSGAAADAVGAARADFAVAVGGAGASGCRVLAGRVRLARWPIQVSSLLVPAWRRRDWREEWESELWFLVDRGESAGALSLRAVRFTTPVTSSDSCSARVRALRRPVSRSGWGSPSPRSAHCAGCCSA